MFNDYNVGTDVDTVYW